MLHVFTCIHICTYTYARCAHTDKQTPPLVHCRVRETETGSQSETPELWQQVIHRCVDFLEVEKAACRLPAVLGEPQPGGPSEEQQNLCG